MALGRHLSLRGLYVLLLGTLVGGQALELRLKDGAHRCEGRVEVKHQGEWGTVYAHGWRLKDASVVCRQLGCGAAIGFPGGAYFGPGLGPIWLFYTSCEGTESTVSDCEHSNIKDYRNDSYSHDDDAGVVCSGFVRLAGGDGPCSGRVEVHSGEAWIPVSDGNFTLATAQIICAELGCGKAVSVLGHELFRESSAQVWAEEFRCEGEEPELWVCPRVPCPGGTCHHSGSAQVVCSAYSEVRLMTNGSSQCEGQVEMNISGQWRALCASHWSLANANVICRQLGCGVAISTPGGPHLVEEGDQILTARFHCSGAESFLWSCPVTVLGGPDCSHGNTASVICSGNQIQVLPQCNDSVSQPTAGLAASEESAPYCSDSRQIRLVDGGGRCSGRVEILDQGSWGTICDDRWDLDDARVVCKQLGCGEALDATVSSFFGTGSGPIWLDEVNCRGEESQVWRCPSWGWRQHNCNHQEDAGVICSGMVSSLNLLMKMQFDKDSQIIFSYPLLFHCWKEKLSHHLTPVNVVSNCQARFMNTHRVCCSLFLLGFVRLAGGDGPCSGRVEVHSGEAWTPVSDGNFTPPTAQVICAELGCGKAVSVLGHMPFRESDGQVWAEEFRCDGGEPELWSCPRVPCPGGTCLHSGAAQVVCSVYTEVQLMKNGTSQCEGQVEMKISGRWRALCASHWSLANANVVCRQLGCGVAISTPRGPHLVEGGDQISTAQFHCSGAESYLWSCPVTALGGPDCSHGNTASVICSGNHTQVLPQCNDFLSQPAGSAASEESSPYCSDSRQLRLVDGGGPCAGRVEILDQGSWGTICDDGWDLDDARVVCRQLGCGEALNATGSAHFGAGSGPIWLDDLNCTGKESHVWRCPSRGWGRHDCRHKEDAGVICSEFLALRMVSEDQQCAGWLEVFYNGTWGSVCRSPMEDITVSVICRQLGCGDSGSLNTSVGLREGSRPRWVDLIQCRKMDTSLWQCPSGPWKYSSCSPKEEAYISCEGRRPKSCPTAAACTDREKLRLRGGDSECSGRVEVWHNGSWGTVCDDSWSLAEAEVVCQQLGCGQALEAVRSAAFGPGNGSIWLDEVQCGGRESSLWDCVAEPWGQSNCKHEEDAGVRCSGVRTTLPTTTAGTRTTSNSLPGIFSLPGVLCLILGSLLFLVLVILVTQLLRWRAERRALSSYEDALAEAVYEELDYLLTQKEGLGSPDQTTEVPDENYDDAEEVPVPGTPSPSQGNEEEVPPEKEDGVRSSQTGSFLNFSREAANPGEGEESFWLLQGKKGDAGYDDVELSALGTSPVTFS
uniref:SRCR domain-containing protein n=1 Tax=Bos indicus x Bos taurus TaxID=30522 RepID=A0A4W2DZF8_BOBOX